jgi:hypothetical protein
MSAVEKIVRIITATEAATPELIAGKIKARKKADLKVTSFNEGELAVATDEGTFRIITADNASFAQFSTFLKRKTSVLLPRLELVQEVEGFKIYKTEELKTLASVIGDANDAFATWLGRYAEARKVGKAKRGAKDENAPSAITEMVNVGNLRGLIDKMVQFNAGAFAVDFTKFSVRENADGSKQVVVNTPFA